MLASLKTSSNPNRLALYALMVSMVLSVFISLTFIVISVSSNFGLTAHSLQLERMIETVRDLADETKTHPANPKAAIGVSISTLEGDSLIFEKLSTLLVTFGGIGIIGLVLQVYAFFNLRKIRQ